MDIKKIKENIYLRDKCCRYKNPISVHNFVDKSILYANITLSPKNVNFKNPVWNKLQAFQSRSSNNVTIKYLLKVAVTFRIMTANYWKFQSQLGLLKLSAPHNSSTIMVIRIELRIFETGNISYKEWIMGWLSDI